ncbi:uncharacterized protein F4807DRAFT_403846 [Annulohypoxylon truncatum]|uniref:uncharacterized protein n=1 Tax=Annulohypoxylon truncatum TaxID=327061 RepID=UPI002008C474|nr:uncharacterized protein F4807DRAFT_403846 [Annulohypoxylon truncatum]KAI1214585.1 hypothetical protein F4807DRAFT_403846 [Annulohypoxylon truncatum]
MSCASSKSSPTRGTSPYKSKLRSNSKQNRDIRASKLQIKLETTQRDIFDWYELNEYKNDAGAIFSPEWQGRLIEWGKEFDSNSMSGICDDIKSYEKNPEELELGRLFQAHPVAAFSLWHVLQSCYELDRIICGTTMQNRSDIAEWQKRRPFQYFLSQDIARCWQKNLTDLLSESEAESCTDEFQREKLAKRLQRIAQAIHALKEAIETLTSVFEGRRKELANAFWMLKVVKENVDKRWPQMAGTQEEDRG